MPTKYMDIKKFLDDGYVQEVNRQFFHPLGLAIEVRIDEDGDHYLGGIWDSQEDPEGIIFSEGVIDEEKCATVLKAREERYDKRIEGVGYWVQPIGEENDDPS